MMMTLTSQPTTLQQSAHAEKLTVFSAEQLANLPQSVQQVATHLSLYIDETTIAHRIQALAQQLNTTYSGVEELTIICVLKGSFMFLSDLVKHLNFPVKVEFIRLASYGNSTQSSGKVKTVDLTLPSLEGKHVLILEDIIDTGLTLSFLVSYLENLHQTASLKLAVFLDKPTARKPEAQHITVDFVAFSIADSFVVGYGLDFSSHFRQLPYVATYIGPPLTESH
jgi:hypoxanthine phosphoribosyltransferase